MLEQTWVRLEPLGTPWGMRSQEGTLSDLSACTLLAIWELTASGNHLPHQDQGRCSHKSLLYNPCCNSMQLAPHSLQHTAHQNNQSRNQCQNTHRRNVSRCTPAHICLLYSRAHNSNPRSFCHSQGPYTFCRTRRRCTPRRSCRLHSRSHIGT